MDTIIAQYGFLVTICIGTILGIISSVFELRKRHNNSDNITSQNSQHKYQKNEQAIKANENSPYINKP